MAEPRRILVIKLTALGDVVQALGAMAAIRAGHRAASITLLTTAPFADWLARSRYFDEVWVDDKPRWWDLAGLADLARRLRDGRFDRVYDLQTSTRSNRYFRLFPAAARPEWSGIADGASHRHRDVERDRLPSLKRLASQLAEAGLTAVPPPDFSWVRPAPFEFALPKRFVLFVPGSSPRLQRKRWPAERYIALGDQLAAAGLPAVLIGGAAERATLDRISAGSANVIDLSGRTSLDHLVALARLATAAIGGDTGPTHLFALAGTPTVALFSGHSDPAIFGPVGPAVRVLQCDPLARLAPAPVAAALRDVLAAAPAGRPRPPAGRPRPSDG